MWPGVRRSDGNEVGRRGTARVGKAGAARSPIVRTPPRPAAFMFKPAGLALALVVCRRQALAVAGRSAVGRSAPLITLPIAPSTEAAAP